MTPYRWRLISAIIAAYLLLDLMLPLIVHMRRDYAVALAIGLVIGQLNLVATWSALAIGKVFVRLPWAAFLATLIWYALVLGNRLVGSGNFHRVDAVILGVLLLCGVLLTQLPLWVARTGYRWRLLSPGSAESSPARLESQFSLGQLLTGMAVVSLALGLGRIILPPGDVQAMWFERELVILLPVVAIVNLAVTAPCIWMAFAPAIQLWGWAAGWVLYALVVSAIEVHVLTALLGPPATNDILMIGWIVNLAQCGTVFGTLLLLRAAGFRLVRWRRSWQCTSSPRR